MAHQNVSKKWQSSPSLRYRTQQLYCQLLTQILLEPNLGIQNLLSRHWDNIGMHFYAYKDMGILSFRDLFASNFNKF